MTPLALAVLTGTLMGGAPEVKIRVLTEHAPVEVDGRRSSVT